jgi:AraC family transcriptional regulator
MPQSEASCSRPDTTGRRGGTPGTGGTGSGPVLLFGSTVSIVRYQPHQTLERHAHPGGGVSVVLAGTITETVNGREVIGTTGYHVRKPSGILHANRTGAEGAVLLAIRGSPAAQVGEQGWAWGMTGRALGLAVNAAIAIRSAVPQDAEEAIALILDLARVDSDRGPLGGGRPPWLLKVRDAIEATPASFSVTAAAREAGVHPVYLARAFRRAFGTSPTAYARSVRVRRAAELILKGDRICDVAATLERSDQSHLCREFSRELDLSPSAFQALVAPCRSPS